MDDKVAAGLWGFILGDALGVPYEFHRASNIPNLKFLEMTPPSGFQRSHAHVPAGTWSDDSSQVMVLLHHLINHNGFNQMRFTGDLIRWRRGWFWVDDYRFDIGMQTDRVILRLANDLSVEEATECSESSNGNGSLMRVIALPLWHRGSDAELVQLAHEQSRVTHAHEHSLVCCAFYALTARELMNQHDIDIKKLIETVAEKLSTIYEGWSFSNRAALLESLSMVLNWPKYNKASGAGYVVDSLWSCLTALNKNNYADAIRAAIAYGNDTDTTAALTGGLAGLRYGMQDVPWNWIKDLRGKDIVRELIDQLNYEK